MDPRVSVVVITRDRRDDLLQALGHLTALPERPAVHLVDNGSSDGSVDAVRAAYPAVDVIALTANLGAAARNLGVAKARTPYVAFADDDSWWAPGSLARAADLLDAHPSVALLNARILVGAGERLDPICEEMAQSPLPPSPGGAGVPLLSFIACAAIVRREPFLAAGGFHERLGVGGEEEIVGRELLARGWRMDYVPELVVHHHASIQRDAHLRRARGIRNTLWTTWLRRPARSAAVRTVRLLRVLPRDRVSVQGVALALAGVPWVLRERRVDPPHVQAAQRLLEAQQLRSDAHRYVS